MWFGDPAGTRSSVQQPSVRWCSARWRGDRVCVHSHETEAATCNGGVPRGGVRLVFNVSIFFTVSKLKQSPVQVPLPRLFRRTWDLDLGGGAPNQRDLGGSDLCVLLCVLGCACVFFHRVVAGGGRNNDASGVEDQFGEEVEEGDDYEKDGDDAQDHEEVEQPSGLCDAAYQEARGGGCSLGVGRVDDVVDGVHALGDAEWSC